MTPRGNADRLVTEGDRSTRVLLAAVVVSGVTTFMFYPLITLELLDRGQSAGGVGIILGLLSGTGQIASGLIGRVNARWGSRPLAVGGLVLRGVGLAVFAVDGSTLGYAVGAVIASLGSGSTSLAIKTELMRTSTSRRTITLRSIAVNTGALIGPSIGGVLFVTSTFAMIVILVVISYALLALVLSAIRFHPPEEVPARTTVDTADRARRGRDRSFPLLLGCTFAYWAVYAQWALVVPVFAEAGFGTPLASTWVYTGNAVLILALQYPVLVRGLAGLGSTVILALGFALFVLSPAVLPLPPGPVAVVAFATLFSLAELLISPTLDEVTGRLRAAGSGLTRAYGLTGSVAGIASLVGASLGGLVIEHSGGPGGVVWLGVPLAVLGAGAALAITRPRESR